jgi:hypothetical protein
LFCSALFAFTVSGTVKTWSSGETLTATDLNTTVQSLKTAVEGATQVGWTAITAAAATTYSAFMTNTTTTTETPLQFPLPRDGVVKSVKLLPSNNSCTVTSTVTLRKNGVDTSVVLTMPASSTALQTSSNTVSFVAGDVLTWRTICTTGSIIGQVAFEF